MVNSPIKNGFKNNLNNSEVFTGKFPNETSTITPILSTKGGPKKGAEGPSGKSFHTTADGKKVVVIANKKPVERPDLQVASVETREEKVKKLQSMVEELETRKSVRQLAKGTFRLSASPTDLARAMALDFDGVKDVAVAAAIKKIIRELEPKIFSEEVQNQLLDAIKNDGATNGQLDDSIRKTNYNGAVKAIYEGLPAANLHILELAFRGILCAHDQFAGDEEKQSTAMTLENLAIATGGSFFSVGDQTSALVANKAIEAILEMKKDGQINILDNVSKKAEVNKSDMRGRVAVAGYKDPIKISVQPAVESPNRLDLTAENVGDTKGAAALESRSSHATKKGLTASPNESLLSPQRKIKRNQVAPAPRDEKPKTQLDNFLQISSKRLEVKLDFHRNQ